MCVTEDDVIDEEGIYKEVTSSRMLLYDVKAQQQHDVWSVFVKIL